MPKRAKTQPKPTTAPTLPAAPVCPVPDEARIKELAEAIIAQQIVSLQLGGEFETVIAYLNGLGYVFGPRTYRQREAFIFPMVRE